MRTIYFLNNGDRIMQYYIKDTLILVSENKIIKIISYSKLESDILNFIGNNDYKSISKITQLLVESDKIPKLVY